MNNKITLAVCATVFFFTGCNTTSNRQQNQSELNSIKPTTMPSSNTLSRYANSDWLFVGGTDVSDNYILPSSLTREGDLVRIFSKNEVHEASIPKAGNAKTVLTQVLYNCKEKKRKIVYVEGYDHDKNLLGKKENEEDKWSPIEPNTIGAEAYGFVCRS